MSNDYSRPHPDMSVRISSAEAQEIVAQDRALREAQALHKPLPKADVIPESALPPGAGAEYINQMLTRADRGGWSDTRDVVRSTDWSGPLPTADAATIDPRSDFGTPRTLATLRPGDTIAYGPTRVEVSQAVAQGLLIPDNMTGGYRLPTSAERPAEQQRAEQQEQRQQEVDDLAAQREAGDIADAETQGAMEIAAHYIPAPVIHALAEDVASNGSFSSANIVEASQRAGIPVEQGQNLVMELYVGGIRQARRAAVSAGVPASEVDDLWEWAQRERPGDHRNAVREIGIAGRSGAVKALAKAYLAQRNDRARNSR